MACTARILLLALAALAAVEGGEAAPDFLAAIQPLASAASGVALPVCSGVLIRGQGLDATSGSYVDKYFILTAASCVMAGASVNVYLGASEVRADAVPDLAAVSMADILIHPEFLTTGMQHSDVAVITADAITAVVTSGKKKLSTARLPTIEDAEDSYLLSGVSFMAWGSHQDASADKAPAVRQVNTHVWPNWVCSVSHLDKHITRQHVCAGGIFGSGLCSGDAGAPLVRNGEVIGLATLVPAPSQGCGGTKPGVFTRLGSHLAWLIKTTNYDPYQQ